MVDETIQTDIGGDIEDIDILLEHTIKQKSFSKAIKLNVLKIHLCAKKGEVDKAYHLINRCLDIYRENNLKDHEALSLIYIEFGLFFSRLGQLYKTIQYYQLGLYYADGFNRQAIYSNLATTFLAYNFIDEASRYYKYAIDEYSGENDKNQELYWVLYINYSEALAKLGRFEEAKNKLDYIVNLPDAPYKKSPTFRFYHQLGYAVIAFEKKYYNEAVKLFLKAKQIAEKSKLHYLIVEINMILIEGYEKIGDTKNLMPLMKDMYRVLKEKNQLEQCKKVLSKLIKHTKLSNDKDLLFDLLMQQNELLEIEKEDKFNDGVITILNEYDYQLDELKSMSKTIELQKNELEQFAYVTAHNLKEPLRNISGFVHLLFKENPKLKSSNKETYNLIRDNARRVELLLDNLERYTSVGYLDEEADVVNLGSLINKIISKIQKKFISRDISFEIAPMPKLNVHPTMIFNLFYELIENAVFFNTPNKLNQVSIFHSEQNNIHQFEITDNAKGICEKQYDKIFHLFSTTNVTNYTKRTGLGLALCKKIISFYNGEISVHSAPNKGSTFIFTITPVK